MHFILDGYNIIKSDSSGLLTNGSLEQQRERLIMLIKDNRPQGSPKNKITIVFDGPVSIPFLDSYASRYYIGEIEIVFSEGQTADKRIEEIVLNKSNMQNEFVVVTDDKGIRRLLGTSNAKFMSVNEFKLRVFKKSKINKQDEKESIDYNSFFDVEEELKKKWLK